MTQPVDLRLPMTLPTGVLRAGRPTLPSHVLDDTGNTGGAARVSEHLAPGPDALPGLPGPFPARLRAG